MVFLSQREEHIAMGSATTAVCSKVDGTEAEWRFVYGRSRSSFSRRGDVFFTTTLENRSSLERSDFTSHPRFGSVKSKIARGERMAIKNP